MEPTTNTTWRSASERLKHDPDYADRIGYVLLSDALLELCVMLGAVLWKRWVSERFNIVHLVYRRLASPNSALFANASAWEYG